MGLREIFLEKDMFISGYKMLFEKKSTMQILEFFEKKIGKVNR
tara:strand:- start:251 stop:379 length:129 start_codon:yes stop_codon:yes gene_type:complete